MRELQAFALAVVLLGGLFLGVTEPWNDDEVTPVTTSTEETVTGNQTSEPDESSQVNATEVPETPLSQRCLDSHESLAMHIHPRLELVINNTSVTVPDNLGIDTSACEQAMHLLHTHDTSGKLHIEGYESFVPTADLIFEVWNISFQGDETLDILFDDPENVTTTVNGANVDGRWHEIELIDGETIRIVYAISN